MLPPWKFLHCTRYVEIAYNSCFQTMDVLLSESLYKQNHVSTFLHFLFKLSTTLYFVHCPMFLNFLYVAYDSSQHILAYVFPNGFYWQATTRFTMSTQRSRLCWSTSHVWRTTIETSNLFTLLHVHASQYKYICFNCITILLLKITLCIHQWGHRLIREKYNPCFLSFTSMMLMITFVHQKSCFLHFCSTQPFTTKESKPDYSLVKS